jgi:hypothetical protein
MFQHTQSCHGDDPIVRVTSTYVNNVYHHVTALMGCEFDMLVQVTYMYLVARINSM